MIETSAETNSYVIIAQRGAEIVYLSKNSFRSKHLECTHKIKIAKRFPSLKAAQKFWKDFVDYDGELKFLEIRGISIGHSLKAEE